MSGDERGLRGSVEDIQRAAETLLPELTRRLREHGLGELEVRHGALRLRIRAAGDAPAASASTAASADAAVATPPDPAAADASRGPRSVVSPAVGIFVYGEGLGPGLEVSGGDPLGHVDMLGVQYDVRAPAGGRISHLVAETGEAVEYGQVLMELEPEAAA